MPPKKKATVAKKRPSHGGKTKKSKANKTTAKATKRKSQLKKRQDKRAKKQRNERKKAEKAKRTAKMKAKTKKSKKKKEEKKKTKKKSKPEDEAEKQQSPSGKNSDVESEETGEMKFIGMTVNQMQNLRKSVAELTKDEFLEQLKIKNRSEETTFQSVYMNSSENRILLFYDKERPTDASAGPFQSNREMVRNCKALSVHEEQKIAELMNFVIDKAEFATAPFNLKTLCREFKEKYGSSSLEKDILRDFARCRQKIVDFQVGKDVCAKVLFCLSAPVDDELLIKLGHAANIKVDDFNRIIKYEKKDGSIQFMGKHCNMINKLTELDKEILKFLAEWSRHATSPITNTQFAADFVAINGACSNLAHCRQRYGSVKKAIFTYPEFDEETRIRMLFVSQARLYPSVLTDLRKKATVKIDKEKRLIFYKAKHGSLKLVGNYRELEENDGFSSSATPPHEFDVDTTTRTLNHRTLPVNATSNEFPRAGLSRSEATQVEPTIVEVPRFERPRAASPVSNTNYFDNNSNDAYLADHFNSHQENVSLARNNNTWVPPQTGLEDHPNLVPLHELLAQLEREDAEGGARSTAFQMSRPIHAAQRGDRIATDVCPFGDFFLGRVELFYAHDMLDKLRDFVHELDKVMLVALEKDIIKTIQKMEGRNYAIPRDEVLKAFGTFLTISGRCKKAPPPSEESIDLREFLIRIRDIFYTSGTSSLAQYQNDIRNALNCIGDRRQHISIKYIRPTLENVFHLLSAHT